MPTETKAKLSPQQESMRMWEEKRQEQRARLLTSEGQSDLGIPPQYHGAKLSDHAHGEFLSNWLVKPAPAFVVMAGLAGTGKTRLLYAAQRHLFWNMQRAIIFTVPEFCARARQAAMADGYEKNFVRTYSELDNFLFLDDLGAEKTTDFVLQELYRVISQRELWGRPTLITTNLSIKAIAGKLDDRIASRLAGGEVLEFEGKDWRVRSKP